MKQHASPAHRLLSLLLSPPACRWAAFAFFVAMVAAGSVPGKAEALSAVVHDKLLHFIAYSVLSTLIYGGLRGGPLRRALLTVAAVAVFGALDEGLQSLLPYRHGTLGDWQVDLLAACVTVAVLSSLQSSRLPLLEKIKGTQE